MNSNIQKLYIEAIKNDDLPAFKNLLFKILPGFKKQNGFLHFFHSYLAEQKLFLDISPATFVGGSICFLIKNQQHSEILNFIIKENLLDYLFDINKKYNFKTSDISDVINDDYINEIDTFFYGNFNNILDCLCKNYNEKIFEHFINSLKKNKSTVLLKLAIHSSKNESDQIFKHLFLNKEYLHTMKSNKQFQSYLSEIFDNIMSNYTSSHLKIFCDQQLLKEVDFSFMNYLPFESIIRLNKIDLIEPLIVNNIISKNNPDVNSILKKYKRERPDIVNFVEQAFNTIILKKKLESNISELPTTNNSTIKKNKI